MEPRIAKRSSRYKREERAQQRELHGETHRQAAPELCARWFIRRDRAPRSGVAPPAAIRVVPHPHSL